MMLPLNLRGQRLAARSQRTALGLFEHWLLSKVFSFQCLEATVIEESLFVPQLAFLDRK